MDRLAPTDLTAFTQWFEGYLADAWDSRHLVACRAPIVATSGLTRSNGRVSHAGSAATGPSGAPIAPGVDPPRKQMRSRSSRSARRGSAASAAADTALTDAALAVAAGIGIAVIIKKLSASP